MRESRCGQTLWTASMKGRAAQIGVVTGEGEKIRASVGTVGSPERLSSQWMTVSRSSWAWVSSRSSAAKMTSFSPRLA